MTDQQLDRTEDRTIPAIVYALYIIGLTHGLTILIGLIVAYVNRNTASPTMRSHYEFLIRTFWLSIGFFALGLILLGIGIPLSVILIGVPFALAGGVLCGLTWLWFLVRCIVGVVHLARGEAYPRPYALVI